MAQEFSFDVVSKVDLQEVLNAVQQGSKEIATRFDFRGSKSKIEWNEKELELTMTSDDEGKLRGYVAGGRATTRAAPSADRSDLAELTLPMA